MAKEEESVEEKKKEKEGKLEPNVCSWETTGLASPRKETEKGREGKESNESRAKGPCRNSHSTNIYITSGLYFF
jgi:hypothetical protein